MADLAQMPCWPQGATEEYIAARQQLLQAERALLDQVGRVAELRRTLPPGAAMPDYTFAEGPMDLARDDPVVTTRLADLVGDRGLVVYHMMYARTGRRAAPPARCGSTGCTAYRTISRNWSTSR